MTSPEDQSDEELLAWVDETFPDQESWSKMFRPHPADEKDDE